MRQSGNILFLILLAVALFAALSYAVTSSMRGEGRNASQEIMAAQAARLIQQTELIAQTVTRLRLVNNCSEYQLNFVNPIIVQNNTRAPGSKICNVYDPKGGALIHPEKLDARLIAPDPDTNATVTNWYNNYAGLAVVSGYSNVYPPSSADLVLYVPFITQEFCAYLENTINGAASIQNNTTLGYMLLYTGDYGSSTGGTQVNHISGCTYRVHDRFYVYYYVLIAR